MSTTKRGNGRVSGPGQVPLLPPDVPAFDPEAEKSVLGTILLTGQPKPILKIANHVSHEDFFWEFHQLMFRAALDLARRGTIVDTITIRDQLETNGLTITEDIRARIDEITGWVPATGNGAEYAKRVKKLSVWRSRRRTTMMLLDAVRNLNEDDWWTAVDLAEAGRAKPLPLPQPEASNVVQFRRTVNGDTGEVISETHHCAGCEQLKDLIKGAETDLRAWRTRYANLKRDKDAAALEHPWWPVAVKLFGYWKMKANHPRSPFTGDRFFECLPYLLNQKYGPDRVERAIAGIAHDPFVTTRRNGTKYAHNDWNLLFRSADRFEEYVRCAPLPWKSELNISPPVSEVGKGKAVSADPDAPSLLDEVAS